METKPIYFIIAGQSNAGGRANGKDLPEELQKEYPDVSINWNNDMNFESPSMSKGWKPLQPQETPMTKGTQFGPEITLGRKLHTATKRPIRLIKFTMGSTNLFVNWNPNGKDVTIGKTIHKNYFSEFVSFCKTSIDTIKDQADFGGIFWMQGEGDAFDKKFANSYYDNFKSLTEKFREVFGDCPVITGLINWKPAKYQDPVNNAIYKLANEDPRICPVQTSDFTTIGFNYDPTYNNHHFDAKSLQLLGNRMADAYIEYNKQMH